MNKNVSLGKVKSVVSEALTDLKTFDAGRIVRGWASTPHKDRGGDIVLPEAFKGTMPQFMQNPIMLYMHSMAMVIGTWQDYKLTDKGLYLEGEIVEGFQQADYVWTLVKRRVLRTMSIGFRENDGGYDKTKDAYVIKELELLENSIVPIPMNQNALITYTDDGKFLGLKLLDVDGVNINFLQHMPEHWYEPSKAFGLPSPDAERINPTSEKIQSEEETTMTPEQEQKLNDTAALAATLETKFSELTAKCDSLVNENTSLKAALEAQKNLTEQLERKVSDTEECIVTLVEASADAEGVELEAESQD